MKYNQSVKVRSMPDRVRRLPVAPNGFPTPWFVAWFKDGKACQPGEGIPDFRVVDTRKILRAVNHNLCWVCGLPMGAYTAFVIGPMCAINRVISEPPAHRDCAIYSATVCPFLSKPNMVRNERGILDEKQALRADLVEAPGIPLQRNPGAVCVWITKSYRPFNPPGETGLMFSIGVPLEALWFKEGRSATRQEVLSAIDSGYPALEELARQEGGDALAALARKLTYAMTLVPAK